MTVQHYDWSAYHSNVRPNKIAIRDLSNNQNLTYKELKASTAEGMQAQSDGWQQMEMANLQSEYGQLK